MSTLLADFVAAGIVLTALPDGRLHAGGPLTDESRAAIRAHKPALLAELAAANDAERAHVVTHAQATELRTLIAVVAADWPASERAEALAVALPDPRDALTSWRAFSDQYARAPARTEPETGPYTSALLAERDSADDRRTCNDCASLSSIGRCLTPPFAAKRDHFPIPDALKRCENYRPKPDEPDQRAGTERWPGVVANTKRLQEIARHA